MPAYTAIVLAAGKGSRTHLDYNKVFYHLDAGHTVLDRSLELFESDPDCRQIIGVCAAHEEDYVKRTYDCYSKLEWTVGGESRQDSVYNGLQKAREDVVMIHDGARPYLKRESLEALKMTMNYDQAALLMIPAVDTVKIVDESGYVITTPNRSQVYQAQTPQAFRKDVILEAHNQAREKQVIGTDDAQLVERFTHVPVACVIGDPSNKKITNPDDLCFQDRD